MFNNNFSLKSIEEGNLLALDITIEDHEVTLINVYRP